MEPLEGNMAGASDPDPVSTRQQRIAELAKQLSHKGLTSLAHHIDLRWLHEAYLRTRPDGAAGVDGQTNQDFNKHRGDNLRALLEQAKSGTYRAPPVRRVYIPKGTGLETRPIGIPTYADKILQRAVVMVLEPIYEQDFLDCSYGFRPGRSAHQALEALWQQTMAMGGGWIVEVDIQKFFDTLDKAQLREFLQRRVRDGVLLRLIGKWLNAGVLEEGTLTTPEAGTPQGGVISPLLANIYLHYVLDVWFQEEVQPRLRGRAFLIRYADDFVMGFACAEDARRVLEVLPKRFGKFGLTLHPDKTRLVPFAKPSRPDQERQARPGTFDLLGFTHFWGLSRRGFWVVKQRTARSRFSRALRRIADWCRKHLHKPLAEQCRRLGQQLRGHFAYYGLTGNMDALQRFRWSVTCLWHKWLARRQRQGSLDWPAFRGLLQRHPLPPATVVHSVYRAQRTHNLTSRMP
jgi:RNA-directed DNA polymerase